MDTIKFANIIDKTDVAILKILQEDATTSNTKIAKELGMVPSAILERIRKIESKGIIKQYQAVLNAEKIKLPMVVFTNIKVNVSNWSKECEEELLAIENIEEIHEVVGFDSYILKIRVKDMDDLSSILKDKIGAIPEVATTQSTMVIKSLRDRGSLPLHNVGKDGKDKKAK